MAAPEGGTRFGVQLRQHRLAADLTQSALAERAGLAQRTIEDLERGVSRPRRETARRLIAALALPASMRAWVEDATTIPRRRVRQAIESSADRAAIAADTAPDQPSFSPTSDHGGVSVPAPASRFVGREPELLLLSDHLTRDGPPIMIVAGEPGLGKSRLLGVAMSRARRDGWCVLAGGCQRRGSQEPFAPVLGALSGFLRGRTPAQLRDDLRGCAWLVRLLPELSGTVEETLPGWAVPPEQERRLIFAAVARLLANAARRDAGATGAGVLLVLDDLQWAGSDALELVTSLVRSQVFTSTSPLRIVGAYRETEVGPADPLGVALADWAHAGEVTHHLLGPLPYDASRHLLDGLLADVEPGATDEDRQSVLRDRVLQRSGGVPFFLVSYAQAVRSGDIGPDASGVPWDAAQGVRQRVAALPEGGRAVLAAAAVVGRVSEPALLMAVMARSEDEILAGLEAANQARLLLLTGQHCQFAHDVVREVVEADLSPPRRAAVHRRTAAAMERLYADRLGDWYEALADQYLRGEAWGQAVEYLRRSGEKAASAGAIREALRHYEQALAICSKQGAPALATAVTVAEKRGMILFGSADFPGAVTDFERMRRAAEQARDRRLEAMALAYGGMSAFYGHEFALAERLLRAALDLAGTDFEDVRLFASNQLGLMFMVIDRHAEAQPLLQVAEELAPRVDDALSRAWWADTGSLVRHWSGRYADALALIDRWQGAVDDSNQLLILLWIKWESAMALGGMGEYRRALALLDELVALCGTVDETFIRARALNTAGWLYGEIQNHERALDLNGQSLALTGAIETADTEIGNNARLNLGDSLAALGRLDEAEAQFQIVERVVRAPRPQDRWMLWRYSQHLFHSYGELWLARGDPERALAYADECLRGAERTDSKKNLAKAHRLRGQAYVVKGQYREAEAALDRALLIARQIGNPPQTWKTLAAMGDLRRAQGSPSLAQQAYREALAVIDEVAAALDDASLREIFLTSLHVDGIRQGAR